MFVLVHQRVVYFIGGCYNLLRLLVLLQALRISGRYTNSAAAKCPIKGSPNDWLGSLRLLLANLRPPFRKRAVGGPRPKQLIGFLKINP